MPVRSEKVTFTGTDGHELAGRLDLPDGEPVAYALFAHCFTCGKDVFAAARIASTLAEEGIAVLRFDFTGLGHSEGEFANTNFSSNVGDLVQAAEHLRRTRSAPKLLIGHSLGGAAVIAAAPQVPEATAVATIGAPAEPAHVTRLLQAQRREIEAKGEAEVNLAGRRFTIRRQFLEDIEGQRLADVLGSLRKALLVFHAPRDEIVAVDNASAIFTAAKHPKSFVSLDDADHLLSRKADATYLARVLAAWAGRYLGRQAGAESQPRAQPAAPAAEPGAVLVRETGDGRFAQEVLVGRHHLAADEPRDVGGRDAGPSPYDFLLAGLGACTSMTLRMYADHKKWPLDEVTVRLKHKKIHAEDCEACETEEGKIDQIEREIEVTGDLDEEQRQRLVEIADRCPVHRTLHSEIQVETKLNR